MKFRKSLAQVFDSKYLEITEKCSHLKCLQQLAPKYTADTAETDIEEIIEKGLDSLYEQVQEKQRKLRQSKEQFDRLALQLFNCGEPESDPN